MTDRRIKGYPGREELNEANMRFRAALTQLHREGVRDPKTAAKLLPLVEEAVQVLERLTTDALVAAGNSERWRAAAAAEAAKAVAVLKPGRKAKLPRLDRR